MTNIYENVVWAKEQVQTLIDSMPYADIEELAVLGKKICHLDFKKGVAFITVLVSGHFYEGGFMMPTTTRCLASYPLIVKKIRRKNAIYFTITEGDYYEYSEYPIRVL